MSTELIARARAGDHDAFGELVAPYERELRVHCYRFLGSVQDAEDALQDTMFAAWRGLQAFQERASVRTWLYRVATNRCLNALRSRKRRPATNTRLPDVVPPEASRLGDVPWLEPFPDILLEGLADDAPGPAARYEASEAISLAFITALQSLPPRQRAVLILRDVLGYHAAEVADILDAGEDSVTSALKRARATMQRRAESSAADEPSPRPNSDVERAVVARLADAFETGDVDALVALLTEDVLLAMPPVPLEYEGRELAKQFFTIVAFREGRRYRVVPTRANHQPAFGIYMRDPQTGVLHANGLIVATLAGNRISALTRFDNSVIAQFGLPRTIDG